MEEIGRYEVLYRCARVVATKAKKNVTWTQSKRSLKKKKKLFKGGNAILSSPAPEMQADWNKISVSLTRNNLNGANEYGGAGPKAHACPPFPLFPLASAIVSPLATARV